MIFCGHGCSGAPKLIQSSPPDLRNRLFLRVSSFTVRKKSCCFLLLVLANINQSSVLTDMKLVCNASILYSSRWSHYCHWTLLLPNVVRTYRFAVLSRGTVSTISYSKGSPGGQSGHHQNSLQITKLSKDLFFHFHHFNIFVLLLMVIPY